MTAADGTRLDPRLTALFDAGATWATEPTDQRGYGDALRAAVERAGAGVTGAEESACVKTNDGHLCFATARADLRYLIQEASALHDTATDERLAELHDVVEHAMIAIRDLTLPCVEEPAGPRAGDPYGVDPYGTGDGSYPTLAGGSS